MERQEIESTIRYISRLLQIEPPKVEIVPQERFRTATEQSAVYGVKGDLTILVSEGLAANKNRFFCEYILAHEMRHCWQIANDLILPQQSSAELDTTAYNEQENEIDAHAFAWAYLGVEYSLMLEIPTLSAEYIAKIKERSKPLVMKYWFNELG